MSHGDEVLFRRWLVRRDVDAFSELVLRHSGMMYATARRVLGSEADAEDVVQESFLRLARQDEAIVFLPGWLHKVAVHLSLNRLRGEKRRSEREKQYHQECAASERGVPQWDEILPVVDEALSELPEKVRVAVVLRFLEGQTHAQAAKELGISRSAVHKRIKKGLEQVRIFLDKRGITSSSAVLGVMFAAHLEAEAAPRALIATLGKQTLASMHTTPTVAKSNLLLKGAIAMSANKTATSLGVLAIILLLVLLAVNTLSTDRSGDAPFKAATGSVAHDTDNTDSPVSAPASSHESGEDMVAQSEAAPKKESTPVAETGSEDSDTTSESVAEEHTSIGGVVQNEDAWPVADAHVWIELHGHDGELPAGFDTRSGEDGRFVLSGITSVGSGMIHIDAEGYVIQSHSMQTNDPRPNIIFTLTRASQFVKGIVVTEDGEPVQDARVSLIGAQENDGESNVRIGPVMMFTATASDGRFEISVPVSKPAKCAFVVVKEGFSKGRFTGIETGAEEARLVLLGYGAIAGRVSNWDGSPAVGAVVAVTGEWTYRPDSQSRYVETPLSLDHLDVTDADGNYQVEGLSPYIRYALGVFDKPETEVRKNYGQWMMYGNSDSLKRLAEIKVLHVDAGDVLPGVDFKLLEDPFLHISGHVYDEASGQPAESMRIGFRLPTHGKGFLVYNTDEEGAYHGEMSLEEESEITAFSAWYYNLLGSHSAKPLKRAEDGLPPQPIRVSPGDDITMDFLVRAPMSIPARVVDEAGQGVPMAGVGAGFVHDDGRWEYASFRAVQTDENGQCIYTGLPPDRTYFLWAQETPDRRHTVPDIKRVTVAQYGPIQGEPGETVPEVVLVIEDKGGIEGILADAEGYPLANVPIVISALGPDGGEPQTVRVQTKDDGRITMVYAFLPAHYPELVFSTTLNGTQLQGRLDDIEIIDGSIVDLGVIALQAVVEDTGENVNGEISRLSSMDA